MAATAGFSAGVQANSVQLSYGVEATWGTAPATTFQAIRLTSEGLSGQKTRQRPQEINTTQEATQAVTTQETASGPIAFALSYGTYDDLMSVVMRNDWQAAQVLNGVAGDITLTLVAGNSGTLSSTTANKFQNINVGQVIRLLGFTNAVNNGYYYVTAKADTTHLTVASITSVGPLVTETPALTAAKVRASTLRNGTQFKSLYIQKQLAAALWLQYPGSFIDQFSISGAVGQFLNGSFNVLAQSEASATADVSTGGVLPAPGGTVNNPIGNFRGAFLNEAPIGSAVDQFSIQVQSSGAAQDFVMGSASAAGIRTGTFTVTGKLRSFFRDFTLYSRFKSETAGRLEFITEDGAGNGYALTLLNATIMNPKIVAGGINQPVYAEFDLEGNPTSTGGTLMLDRLPAT